MLTNAELVFTSRFRRSETHESTCPRPAYVAQEILQEETAIYNHLISAMFGIVRCVKRAREQQANCLICSQVRMAGQAHIAERVVPASCICSLATRCSTTPCGFNKLNPSADGVEHPGLTLDQVMPTSTSSSSSCSPSPSGSLAPPEARCLPNMSIHIRPCFTSGGAHLGSEHNVPWNTSSNPISVSRPWSMSLCTPLEPPSAAGRHSPACAILSSIPLRTGSAMPNCRLSISIFMRSCVSRH
jgi:hypothetical protein